MRQVPDISLSAAGATPGYLFEGGPNGSTPSLQQVGGTSLASPAFAGVIAILNQAVGGRVGNINPMLYQLAGASFDGSPLRDITKGNNEIVCGAAAAGDAGSPDGGDWPDAGCSDSGLYGYVATTGYDCASGLGSIDAYNLVSAWLGMAATNTGLVASPNPTAEGATVSLTATVSVEGTNTNALGGSVTFAFQSYTITGAPDLSWELGTVTITGGSTTGGQAVLETVVPPGLVKPGHQEVDVVAMYTGDVNHRPSNSTKTSLAFAPLSFAIVPSTLSLAPGATESFATTGGHPPVQWLVAMDTSGGYYSGASITADGGFTADPSSSYVEVEAIDSYGAEAIAHVTVGSPTPPAPWDVDAGIDSGPGDAGADSGTHDAAVDSSAHDAGADSTTTDAGAHDASAANSSRDVAAGDGAVSTGDAGHARDAVADHVSSADAAEQGNSSGGGCTMSGVRTRTESAPLGAFGSLLVGIGFMRQRRRSGGLPSRHRL
jgi:hypothetical protein